MVSPIYLIALPLAAAFFISFFDKLGRWLSMLLFYTGIAAVTALSGYWLYVSAVTGSGSVVYTAGFAPPLSIALRLGLEEAFFLAFANLAALGAAVVLGNRFRRESVTAMVLFLLVVLGAQGIIMTQDLFNLFVFLEISSIATYSLLAIERNRGSMSAGFKYIIAGGIASALILLGITYLYRIAGSLAIDDVIAAQPALAGTAGFTAVFFTAAAILIELKPFPANGWALDVYQASQSGVVSVIAVVNSAAVFYGLMKLFPLFSAPLITALSWIGIATFFFSNLIGLRQSDVKRMLGYSSSAQIGLMTAVLSLSYIYDFSDTTLLLTLGLLFLGHLFSKAGLFWLTETRSGRKWSEWTAPRGVPGVMVFGVLIAALAGLPPFPAFWAKWVLVRAVITQSPWLVVLLLTGSLCEAFYLLRWFGRAMYLRRAHAETPAEETASAAHNLPDHSLPDHNLPARILLPAALSALALTAAGLYGGYAADVELTTYIPLAAGFVLLLLSWMPAVPQAAAALALTGGVYYLLAFESTGIAQIFSLVFYGGGAMFLIATLYKTGKARGFYPFFTMLILSLGGLVHAASFLEFFLAWELMTVSSYFLIFMGHKAEKASLTYIAFSLGGAFLVMSGLALLAAIIPDGLFQGSVLAGEFSGQPLLEAAPNTAEAFHSFILGTGASGGAAASGSTGIPVLAGFAFAMLALGFLVKTGAAGLHIWLPDAYAEAGDDVTPLLSAVLSKAGIFGLILFTLLFPTSLNSWIPLPFFLRWVGALTAFFGTFLAVFEEDIKRVFAYSSMGQLGYIILAVGLMSSLGWTTALYLTVLHLLFKGMLFLTAAGVIERTGTRQMYLMGGLIKKMPVSFFSALLAIIALSGVPPLAGFGGKWLIYNALIQNGHTILAALAFFASTIAFLYLFRFIYVVFLGQLKFEHRQVKEAPVALIFPQVVFILLLMSASMFPSLLIKPLQSAVAMFPGAARWEGSTLMSSIGYWNGSSVMWVTMAVFILLLAWLLIVQRKPQPVGQFNIVFAAERPERPETTHYGHNFFAPYRRALGFLAVPGAVRFWNGVAEFTASIGGALRRIYTGNGQTYALHILLFISIIYFLIVR